METKTIFRNPTVSIPQPSLAAVLSCPGVDNDISYEVKVIQSGSKIQAKKSEMIGRTRTGLGHADGIFLTAADQTQYTGGAGERLRYLLPQGAKRVGLGGPLRG